LQGKFRTRPLRKNTNEELRDAIHPDDRARAVAAIEGAIETGDDYDVEYRIIRPDGTTGWVMIRGRLIRDNDGRYIAMSGVSLDIGRSKKIEAALIESEARFKTFAQAMPNQVWSATPDGLLDWFNEQVLSYSGLTFDDLMGTGWAQMVHPADIVAAASAWEKALTEAIPYQAEFRLRRSDGAWRWHIARALPIKDKQGAITRWIGTNIGMDDQKAVAAQLAESEQRASAAIDAADIGIWDFDPRTGTLTWDKRCYGLFGLAQESPFHSKRFWLVCTLMTGMRPRKPVLRRCVRTARGPMTSNTGPLGSTMGLTVGLRKRKV
jgi:PAS domain S-box-containing protein